MESQAIGRIFRLGQDKPVKIVRYITKNTVEEVILITLSDTGPSKAYSTRPFNRNSFGNCNLSEGVLVWLQETIIPHREFPRLW